MISHQQNKVTPRSETRMMERNAALPSRRTHTGALGLGPPLRTRGARHRSWALAALSGLAAELAHLPT